MDVGRPHAEDVILLVKLRQAVSSVAAACGALATHRLSKVSLLLRIPPSRVVLSVLEIVVRHLGVVSQLRVLVHHLCPGDRRGVKAGCLAGAAREQRRQPTCTVERCW